MQKRKRLTPFQDNLSATGASLFRFDDIEEIYS